MPAAFTLYGNVASTATNRVRLMLADANFTDYDFVVINFQKSEQKSPEHLARNPYGRVPALTMPDGFTLYESRAICQFLCAHFSLPHVPPPSSSPAGLRARALFDQAEAVETSQFTPALDVISYEKFVKATMGLPADEAKVAEARARLEAQFGVLDEHVLRGGREWMAGAAFGLVDVCYLIAAQRLKACGEGALVEGRRNVSAWWERCLERPAVKKFLGELLTLPDILKRLAAAKAPAPAA